uniref:U5 small nuclear ribonucleoprotein helicase n=1 Tax=Syphacia muris TaxID=451379 RepID=A0A0N5AID2_9BILA
NKGALISCDGEKLYKAVHSLPFFYVEASVKPVTSTIIQITVTVTPDFTWNDRFLGGMLQAFWIFVENLNENFILHYERLVLKMKTVKFQEPLNFIFTVPIHEKQLSHNYQVRVSSDYFVIDDNTVPISMHNCVLPFANCLHTDLLDLDPLPITALHNKQFESIYNILIQYKVFHTLYNTDKNCLIGAPTGSGKTLCAELAIFRIFLNQPSNKCVYIAPLKALVRERVFDWTNKFAQLLGVKTVELTGDHTPDLHSLAEARLVITTPEKWDGITRAWEARSYVKKVALLIIDEIHLLGVERGAVLEAIITRIKLMSMKHGNSALNLRVIGLSTALANAGDVAEWLGVPEAGLYNFRPNVRPVPVQVHIAGFTGQHYCPRMALMNKPAFKAVKMYSPTKPVLVFVASRRQTRLTAMAFISQLVSEENPSQWLHMDVGELEPIIQTIKDQNLKLTLPFGIGMHHAGLQNHERNTVEQLFLQRKIQVLITTATLAWGMNLPAHLVIVKGTEFYDGKTHKYVDFPVTDVLQMMGRAGRPQYDNTAVAVIYVQDIKKNFYKRFLYEPFPVESSLLKVLPNHINAEIHSGTIINRQQIMEYIANTYLYRRLFANPGYYEVPDTTVEALTSFLVGVVDTCVEELVASKCIVVDEDEQVLKSTPFGHIASVYYLRHETVRFFSTAITSLLSVEEMLNVLADNPEFAEIPVRHNEDQVNMELQRYLPIKLPSNCDMSSSYAKAHLLFQAHLCRIQIPTDYVTDLRSLLSQCIRILQAMLEVCMFKRWLASAINVITLMQMIVQARWHTDPSLLVLPHFDESSIDDLLNNGTIPMVQSEFHFDQDVDNVESVINRAVTIILERTLLDDVQARDVVDALLKWPIIAPKKVSVASDIGEIEFRTEEPTIVPKAVQITHGKIYNFKICIEAIGINKSDHLLLKMKSSFLEEENKKNQYWNTDTYSPRFSKEKTAGWIIIIGEKDTGEVMGFRKIQSIMGRKVFRIEMKAPEKTGNHVLTIFVFSDTYLGIDQEYDFHCNVS